MVVLAAPKTQQKVSLKQRTVKFLREVRAELRKVVWPNREELKANTIAVIVLVVLVAVAVGIVDLTFGEIINVIRGLGG